MFKTRLLKWSKVRIFGVAASIQTLEHEEARKGARGEKEKVEKTKLWRSMARSNECKIQRARVRLKSKRKRVREHVREMV